MVSPYFTFFSFCFLFCRAWETRQRRFVLLRAVWENDATREAERQLFGDPCDFSIVLLQFTPEMAEFLLNDVFVACFQVDPRRIATRLSVTTSLERTSISRSGKHRCFPFPNADFRDIRRYAPINTENTWREQNFNDAELITFSPQSSLPRSKTDFQGILWSTLIHDFTETRERKHDMHGSPAVTNESAKRVSNAGYKNKINQTSESKRGDASRIGNPRHEDESNTPKQWPRMERNLRVKLVESNARIKPRKRL